MRGFVTLASNCIAQGKDSVRDDYEEYLQEWESLVETQYHDSLVLAGLAEPEEEDFVRRRWVSGFVNLLTRFVDDHGDASVGARSLAAALRDAELRGKRVYLVWLGPSARQWLRAKLPTLKAFFGGRYATSVNYL